MVKHANLFEGSHGSAELVEQADGDAEHRGERQTPTDHLPPPWVHVHIVVGKRFVINKVKQEDTLRREEKVWTLQQAMDLVEENTPLQTVAGPVYTY